MDLWDKKYKSNDKRIHTNWKKGYNLQKVQIMRTIRNITQVVIIRNWLKVIHQAFFGKIMTVINDKNLNWEVIVFNYTWHDMNPQHLDMNFNKK